jgi:hypothetical protein
MALLRQYFDLRDQKAEGAEEDGAGKRRRDAEESREAEVQQPSADADTRRAALAVLEEAIAAQPPHAQEAHNVVFDSVELHGFGSFGFGRKVRYPLADRGVVLVMGRNEDEASADSNGSGKTTLCMAALWALTGSADVRADGKRLGRKDVIHCVAGSEAAPEMDMEGDEGFGGEDEGEESVGRGGGGRGGRSARRGSGAAAVKLCGTVDGQPWELLRRMAPGKGGTQALRFKLNGEDRTQTSLRDTQEEVERVLPVAVLADAVFHGQVPRCPSLWSGCLSRPSPTHGNTRALTNLA